ncbi:hypothetical protein ACGGZK_11260 [Agromyces sp. MMS24-K17]|uniref:hypothetical protein n=1 Tax=Agromyces sp. MMS24-K17 TaxID=3372850 RepID=UPI0037546EF5
MAAQFLRLKLQLLANIFRRSPWQVVGIVLGLAYGLFAAVLLFGALVGLRLSEDVSLIRDILVVGGSATVLGFTILPLLFGVDDTLDPRRFALFGLPDRRIAFGLALAALIGVPSVVLAIVLVGTIVTWSRGPGEIMFAVLGAALAFLTCVLIARVTTGLASLLLATRRAREVTGALAVLLLVVLAPAIALLATIDWQTSGLRVLESIAEVLSWTPLGAAFASPGDAASGDWGGALLKFLIAAATVWLIWLAWQGLVRRMLVSPGRAASTKHYRGLGWFDRMPGTATGAIAARSLTYWFRDARYWVSLVMLPIMPVLVIVVLTLAGVPTTYLPLVPVPLISLFLGWLLHNDTAFDSTAIWLHVASGMRGAADRFGRILPVLVVGIIVIGVGSAVTAVVIDDWRLVPSLIGVSASLLLTGLGVGAISSARFPYPAAKPGDSPFQQPQSSGTMSALVQSVTLVGSLVITAPTIVFGVLGVLDDPSWHLAALVSGTVLGILVLVLGILVGGRVVDRRGPEILAASLRA